MRAVRPVAISTAVAITTFLIAMMPLHCAVGAEIALDIAGSFVIAQTSMGAPDPVAPSAPSAPTPAPRMDYIPPSLAPTQQPAPRSPAPAQDDLWGAIGFTADGSYSTVWKQTSKGEAEAGAAKGCAKFGRGGCEVVSISGQSCAALATFLGRRWKLSFTSGGDTYPDAQRNAMDRCNSDQRTRGQCQIRTTICADGR
jgi:hypothetical protein